MNPRKIKLSGQETDYFLKRGNRRTVGLRIDSRGLTVSIPLRMPEEKVESILVEKSGWILKKLRAIRSTPTSARKWTEGESFPFLGRNCTLRISHFPRTVVELGESFLEVGLPEASPQKIEAAVRNWYRRQAMGFFAERVAHYCARLGVDMPRLFLSNAKTRWGSCNSKGEVRLNWRLVCMSPDLVDYVVVHELSHLVEMNHSEAFWKTVASVYPSFEHARAALRRCAGDSLW